MKSAYYGLFLAVSVAAAGCSPGSGGLTPAAGGLIPGGASGMQRASNGHKSGPSDPTIYMFAGTPDGGTPEAGLLNVGGTFYGTTDLGGTNNLGSVFSVTPGGSENLLYSFSGSDGQYPFASLINVNGTLYGTTGGGGASNQGCIFSITPAGKETVLYSFSGFADGAKPLGALVFYKGALYGTTQNGGSTDGDGGVIFVLPLHGKTAGPESVLHTFAGGRGDGAAPSAGLVVEKGVLYGTTTIGGPDNVGVLFGITPAGSYNVLHAFIGQTGGAHDGATPEGPMIAYKGALYGMTYGGGKHNLGTAFKLTPTTGAVRILHSFGGPGDGSRPELAGLTNGNGTFYGTTPYSQNAYGTVFSITPSGTYSMLYNFVNPPGTPNYPDYPAGSVIDVNNVLYGTTTADEGTNDGGIGAGTVFALPL